MNYKQKRINGVDWKEHRWVWTQANGAIPKGMEIDHINSNVRDNRIENLQLVTPTQNKQRKNQSQGYTIIPNKKTRPYKAMRKSNGKQIHIGYFGTPCGAYMAHRTFFI